MEAENNTEITTDTNTNKDTQGKADTKILQIAGVVLFGLILVCALLFYLGNLTHSPLWYDEAVEYFFSKYTTGTVPAGGVTTSMYERICCTFQPPLYNVLAHVWLCFFDTEAGFRFAGVLVSLIGAVGFWMGLKKITDTICASVGAGMLLASFSYTYYALECGEYHLMLCFLSWAICFYLYAVTEEKPVYTVLFVIFCCLTMYSQYGAAFLVIPLFAALAIHVLITKKQIKTLLFSGLCAIAAAVPLIYYFLLPQLANQGTTDVSHAPYFAYGSAVEDFFLSFRDQFQWLFLYFYADETQGLWPLVLPVIAGLLLCLLGIFARKANALRLILISAAAYVLYYIASACSYYGYNDWGTTVGTENIGNRYGLFLLPILVCAAAYGLYLSYRLVRDLLCNLVYDLRTKALQKKEAAAGQASASPQAPAYARILTASGLFTGILLCLTLLPMCGFLNDCYQNAIGGTDYTMKSDSREAVAAWYDSAAPESFTLVHDCEAPTFAYYLRHDGRYDEACEDRLYYLDSWIRYAGAYEVDLEFEEGNVWLLDDFYYVGSLSYYVPSSYGMVEASEARGYTVDPVYCKEEEDDADVIVLHIHR